MSTPLVSVVVPAFNAEQWLPDAIASVLSQRLGDLELIVVNDGSKDRTSEVARGTGDPRVHVIDKENGGVSAARNTGIDASRGKYIAFLDADDAMLPDNLQAKVDHLETCRAQWLYSDLWLCDEKLHPTGIRQNGTDGDVIDFILSGRGAPVPAAPSNILARRSCFNERVRFDSNLSNAADQDMVIQLARKFDHAHLPEPLFQYRVRPGSMSRDLSLFERDHLHLFRKARECGLLDDPAYRNKCMANAYWTIGGSWWINAGGKRRALPFLVRAVMLRPRLALRPFKNLRPGWKAAH